MEAKELLKILMPMSKEVFGDIRFVNNASCVQLLIMVYKDIISVEEAKLIVEANAIEVDVNGNFVDEYPEHMKEDEEETDFEEEVLEEEE